MGFDEGVVNCRCGIIAHMTFKNCDWGEMNIERAVIFDKQDGCLEFG